MAYFNPSFFAVKRFSWDTVWVELVSKMQPTLMFILIALVPDPVRDKPLLCLIALMLLKVRLPKMGLVQRALSIVL